MICLTFLRELVHFAFHLQDMQACSQIFFVEFHKYWLFGHPYPLHWCSAGAPPPAVCSVLCSTPCTHMTVKSSTMSTRFQVFRCHRSCQTDQQQWWEKRIGTLHDCKTKRVDYFQCFTPHGVWAFADLWSLSICRFLSQQCFKKFSFLEVLCCKNRVTCIRCTFCIS